MADNTNTSKVIGAIFLIVGMTSCGGDSSTTATAPVGVTFTDSAFSAGLGAQPHTSWSSAWRDFDLDGWPDLFVSNHGPAPSLFRNNRDGTFTDVSATMPLALVGSDIHGVAWANIDADAAPELMIEVGANQGTSTSPKFLLDRVGAAFVDIAPIANLLDPFGRGRTPLWTEINGDGLLDIILMNEFGGIGGQSQGMRFFCRNSTEQYADCTSPNLPATVDRFSLITDLGGDERGELVLFSSGNLTGYATLAGAPFEVKPFLDGSGLPITVGGITNAQSGDFNGDGLADILLVRSVHNSAVESWGGGGARAYLQATSRKVGFDINTSGDLFMAAYSLTNQISSQNIFIGATGRNPVGCSVGTSSICTMTLSKTTDAGMLPHMGGQNTGLYIGYDPQLTQWSFSLSSQTASITSSLVIDSTQPASIASAIQVINLEPVILYNHGNGRFTKTNIVDTSGIGPFKCANAAVADFDNNAFLDILFTCRNSVRTLGYSMYWNSGGGVFQSEDITATIGGVAQGVADAPSVADFDQNGFADVFVPHGFDLPPFNWGIHKLLRNKGNANHWLAVELVGLVGNLDAVGTVVTVRAGAMTQRRYSDNGASHHAQNDRVLLFGLGGQKLVNSLDVHWSDGATTTLINVAPDQKVLVVHP